MAGNISFKRKKVNFSYIDSQKFSNFKLNKPPTLLSAIRKLDIDLVESLIDNGADVNKAPKIGIKTGVTPLHEIFNVIKNISSEEHSEKKQEKCAQAITIVKLLLDAGADVNAYNRHSIEKTVLLVAVKLNNPELLKFILARRPNLETEDYNGKTPLYYAFSALNFDAKENYHQLLCIKLLLDAGAQVKSDMVSNRYKMKFLPWLIDTIQDRSKPIIEYIETQKGYLSTDRDYNTLKAVKEYSSLILSILSHLINSHQIDLEEKIENGITPLSKLFMLYIQPGTNKFLLKEAIKIFLNAGADTHPEDNSGFPIRECAVFSQDEELIEEIIKREPYFNAEDRHKNTLLHIAVIRDNPTLVKNLIKKGADVNAINKYGESVFEILLNSKFSSSAEQFKEKTELITIFIEAGVYINASNKYGESILKTFVERTCFTNEEFRQKFELIKIFVNAGAQFYRENPEDEIILSKVLGETIFHTFDLEVRKELLTLLLKAGADINSKDVQGNTLLHYAVQEKDKDWISFLLIKKADINASNNYDGPLLKAYLERTSFSNEEFKQKLELMKIFVSAGGKVHRENPEDEIILSKFLCKTIFYDFDFKDRKELLTLLLKAGADINSKDDEGNTLLHFAVQEKDKDWAEFLLSKNANINAKNILGTTPIEWSRGSKLSTLLINNGASLVNTVENNPKSINYLIKDKLMFNTLGKLMILEALRFLSNKFQLEGNNFEYKKHANLLQKYSIEIQEDLEHIKDSPDLLTNEHFSKIKVLEKAEELNFDEIWKPFNQIYSRTKEKFNNEWVELLGLQKVKPIGNIFPKDIEKEIGSYIFYNILQGEGIKHTRDILSPQILDAMGNIYITENE